MSQLNMINHALGYRRMNDFEAKIEVEMNRPIPPLSEFGSCSYMTFYRTIDSKIAQWTNEIDVAADKLTAELAAENERMKSDTAIIKPDEVKRISAHSEQLKRNIELVRKVSERYHGNWANNFTPDCTTTK